MSKVFMVDVAKCNGCYTCQTVCKDEHVGNDWTPYAAPQPEIGQFWVKVDERVGGTVPKVKSHYVPLLCNHCEKPACIPACAAGAIEKREDGLVVINPETCTGCGLCKDACPYGVIYQNEDTGICQKCTGCAHLIDGGDKVPRCVEACPTDALMFGEKADFEEKFIKGAATLKPETACFPQTYYRNIPGRFIAGTLFDPEQQEVLIGAKVRATNGGKMWEVTTDDFGDFWITDLAEGYYHVVAEADGYEYEVFPEVDLTKDVNLGDIPMKKK